MNLQLARSKLSVEEQLILILLICRVIETIIVIIHGILGLKLKVEEPLASFKLPKLSKHRLGVHRQPSRRPDRSIDGMTQSIDGIDSLFITTESMGRPNLSTISNRQ